MKAKIQKKNIQSVIKKLLPLARGRSPLPILDNFLIVVKDNKMSITATKLVIFGTGTLEIEGEGKYSFCVDAQKLSAIVDASKDIIDFEYNSDEKRQLIIKSGHSTHKLGTEAHEDYPRPEKLKDPKAISIPNMAKIFKRSIHIMSPNEMKISQHGISIHKDGIKGTDGSRAIINKLQLEIDKPILIPAETAVLIANMAEEITLEYTEEILNILTKDFVFQSKLADAEPPNIESVMPKNIVVEYTMKTEDFRSATRTVMIALNTLDVMKPVKLTFEKEGTLVVSAQDPEVGTQSVDKIKYEIKTTDGEGVTFPILTAINGGYLTDLLSILDTETITLCSASIGGTKAFIVKEEDFTYLMMPQRIH